MVLPRLRKNIASSSSNLLPAVEFCAVLVEENGCTGDGVIFGLTVVDDAALGFATGRGLGRGRVVVDMNESIR